MFKVCFSIVVYEVYRLLKLKLNILHLSSLGSRKVQGQCPINLLTEAIRVHLSHRVKQIHLLTPKSLALASQL